MSHFPRLAALFLSTALAACATAEDQRIRSDPNFEAGYSSGCTAATNEGADYRREPKRDKDLYENDEAYRRGWGSGYAACRRTMTSPNSTPGSSPIPEPSPGH